MTAEAWRSAGRKALILLLLVTAVLLARKSGYYDGLNRLVSVSAGETAVSPGNAAGNGASRQISAVTPAAAVVCTGNGGRCGSAWDADGTGEILRNFSADLAEALGSAGVPASMTEAELQAALSDPGVFLRFDAACPLALLADWLGTGIDGATGLSRVNLLLLHAAEDATELCFRAENGELFRCTTAASVAGLAERAGSFVPNDTRFAFENDLLSGGDGFFVIPPSFCDAAEAKSSRILLDTAETEALMALFGMNSHVASDYTEADGTVVYVEGDATLRVGADGTALFRSSAPQDSADPGMVSAVNLAWSLAGQSIGSRCGAASLRFDGVEQSVVGPAYTVTLQYALDGIPVRLSDGSAGEITVRGGTVTYAKLQYRSFVETENRFALLPCLQAAAIAAAEGTTATPAYAEAGDTLTCSWVKTDG